MQQHKQIRMVETAWSYTLSLPHFLDNDGIREITYLTSRLEPWSRRSMAAARVRVASRAAYDLDFEKTKYKRYLGFQVGGPWSSCSWTWPNPHTKHVGSLVLSLDAWQIYTWGPHTQQCCPRSTSKPVSYFTNPCAHT